MNRDVADKRHAALHAVDALAAAKSDARKSRYKVMLYGFGEAAAAGLFAMLTRDDLLSPLEIYIAGNTKPGEQDIRRARLAWEQREQVIVNPRIAVHPITIAEAADYIPSIDLCVVTADRAVHRTADRLQTCKENLPIAHDIAELVKKSEAHFDIVTNLGELLAYVIFKETGCNPFRLSGNAHVDKMRLDALITKHLATQGLQVQRTDGFVVGTHQNPWPVVNNMRIDAGHGYVPLSDRIGLELQKD